MIMFASLPLESLSSICRNFIKNETLVQVFSCEVCKIFINTYFTAHFQTTVSTYAVFHLATINCQPKTVVIENIA